MEKSLLLTTLFIGFDLFDAVNSFPVDFSSQGAAETNSIWLASYFLTAIGFLLSVIGIAFGCVCCRNGKGFKEFSNSSRSLANSPPEGFVNPTSNSELTIFPPSGANSNQICRFEPLPNIRLQPPNLRPAAFCYSERQISSQDWFWEPHNNFPRNQLKYVQEYGRGWFGRVVEGEAQNITPKEKLTKVMVKILHEDATPTDQMYFLHEVKFYRDLKHPNVLRLLGRCLETEPFLIILEFYPNGDLKSFLSQNLASARALAEQGVLLQMCSNITSGLQYMHDNKFIHTDLAARNCLVGPDLTVKIGDYGNSIEIFKSDYYCAGSVALPIRWCAPETLKCTDVTIETREVTPPANIWSLAVVFWEISEFCNLPYAELNDDQVIVRVLGEKNYFLEKPKMFCLHKDELYRLMKLCWNPPLQRPTASQIYVILNNLISSKLFKLTQNKIQIDSKQISPDFEQRWQNLKPNYIPKKDEVNYTANCNILSSKMKNAKVVDSSLVDLPVGIFMSDSSCQESPRFCLKSENEKSCKVEQSHQEIQTEKCIDKSINQKQKLKIESEQISDIEDLKVRKNFLKTSEKKFDLESSFKMEKPENLTYEESFKKDTPDLDSWLKGVEINNEEDENFVRKISEAIRDLDATLAMERTSSSEESSGKSSHQNSPGKDLKENAETVVDFRLGSDTSSFINFTQKSFELSSLQNTEQPQSLNFTESFLITKKNEFEENYDPGSLIMPIIDNAKNKLSIKNDGLDESLKENDSLSYGQSRNSSDTDDEVWRKRIEKGEISEKVKEKSKSIANLMILTHIDASDDSDIDIDKPLDKGVNRNSFMRRSGSFAKSSLSSNNFGSENDISNAVLEDDFKESLKKLSNDHKEHGHFDSLGVILPSSVLKENIWENFFKFSDTVCETSSTSLKNDFGTGINKEKENLESDREKNSKNFPLNEEPKESAQNSNNFLGNVASEKLNEYKVSQKTNLNKTPLNRTDVKEINEIINLKKKDLIKEYPKGDNNKCNIHKNTSSESNSSHLKQSNVESFDISETKDSLTSELDKKNEFFSILPDKNEEVENSKNTSLNESDSISYLADPLLKKEKSLVPNEKSSQNNMQKNINLTNSGNLDAKLYKKSNKTVIPKIVMTQAEENNVYEHEEVYEPIVSKCKPFRFILKDSEFIPSITVTEEPEEELVKEEEKFEFVKPKIKTFKFILKDDEILPDSDVCSFNENKVNEKNLSDLKQKSLITNFEGDYFGSNKDKDNSERIMPNDASCVIIGACEDFTLDYFKGLKTISKNDDTENNVEEISENNLQENIEDLSYKDANVDIWNKHLEKTLDQQLKNADFNDIKFRTFGLDYSAEDMQVNEIIHLKNNKNFDSTSYFVKTIADFIESEKVHTEKVEEPIQIYRMTNLTGMGTEEEFDNFKLRTPDDERSSDSGFRDKGSLSESVEDACEGKYNLEDIEAELEEAYVKGAFGNCEIEKESDPNKRISKNCNNFEYEESKFYEDENKNEEDFSDIDGEIEFWQNKDNSDYYPEISEFNPTCSEGWYLHPPEENILNFNRNFNEDVVNALRNELRESLPIQTRSFDEFNGFYEPESDDIKKELNIHYISHFAVPLSPIIEEQGNSLSETSRKNVKNSFFKGSNRIRKNIINLMESVKSIDTNTFMQYLDYMIENEGKDLDELEEMEEDINEIKGERMESPLLIIENESKILKSKNFEADVESVLENDSVSKSENLMSNFEQNNSNFLVKDLECEFTNKIDQESKKEDDILIVNIDTNEVTLLESSKPKTFTYFMDTMEPKDSFWEVISDNSEGDRLIFTPEVISPDREFSRSSNAMSDITLSSPDCIPDCFSNVQEIIQNDEGDEKIEEFEDSDIINEVNTFVTPLDSSPQDSLFLPSTSTESKEQNDIFLNNEQKQVCKTLKETSDLPENLEVALKTNQISSKIDCVPETSNLYEMTTSFMGDDNECESDNYLNLVKDEQKLKINEQTIDQKSDKKLDRHESYIADWESGSSEEELSTSSGEFIWKDGGIESKVKAIQASSCDIQNSLNEESQSDQNALEIISNCSIPIKKDINNEKNEVLENDDEDDDNESSTGSSASITDFIPSAWNSQATPSRSAIKSPDKKVDLLQKKSVWFKKQKYHCVYEYPREPSDNEDVDNTLYDQFNYEKNTSEAPSKHFTFGMNTIELPNKHFLYGISNVIDYSNYSGWDILEGEDANLSLTDTDSDNGLTKTEMRLTKEANFNFHNLSHFDYDFSSTGMLNDDSEFFVSSSSRPFQGSSSNHFFSSNTSIPIFNDIRNSETTNLEDVKIFENNVIKSKDFSTPDSGLEDSANVTPLERKVELNNQEILLQVESPIDSKSDIINLLDNLKFNFTPEVTENNIKKINLEPFENSINSNCNVLLTSNANKPSSLLSPSGLGELRHARNRLKLDLPLNHNAELGAVISKKNQQNSVNL